MSIAIDKPAFESLIGEDLEWLSKQPNSFEKDHIEALLKQSPAMIYDTNESTQRQLVLLAAKILEPLNAGLPSCYYEALEHEPLEKIAEVAVKRIRNTVIIKEEQKMTTEIRFTILLANKGGMTIEEGEREVFPTDEDMATAIGKSILDELKKSCEDIAEVTVKMDLTNEIKIG